MNYLIVDFPRGPEGVLTFPNANESPIDVILDLLDTYGEFVTYRTKFGRFYILDHPSIVQQALTHPRCKRNKLLKMALGDGVLSTNDETWLTQRRSLLPTFRRDETETWVPIFRQITEERIRDWTSRPLQRVDITREMFRIALSNVTRVLIDAEFDDEFLEAVECVVREVAVIQNPASFGFPLIRTPTSLREYKAAVQAMDETIAEFLDAQRRGACPNARLPSLCPHSRSSESTTKQQRDEVLTMIIAGHETTAVALSWAIYSIASHPEVADQLCSEVDRVIGDRPIEPRDLSRLPYTRAIIDETLRLYPPIWFIARESETDIEIGGHQIPANSGILVSPFSLHRKPEFWNEPDAFRPQRFFGDVTPPSPYSYLPFYAGRHLCLGKHFALAEMVVVLATIAQRFRFQCPAEMGHHFEPLASLRIRGGLRMTLQPRTSELSSC